MTLGTMISLTNNVEEDLAQLKELGLSYCQLRGWDESLYTKEVADRVLKSIETLGITITTFWCGWPGPQSWNFYEGPLTLGLAPVEFRYIRCETLKKGSDFAKMLDVDKIATHVGFIPENPNDPIYSGLLVTLKELVAYCRNNGQSFLFETGQETPVTLRRAIDDLGGEGVGINFDPANLLLYGKASPVDALDVFGEYVMDVHAKDGSYPKDGHSLGEEKPLGEGLVNFPLMIEKLKKLGYDGPLTIEREVTGEQQRQDILRAVEILKKLI